MSYNTTPAFIKTGTWDAETRSHPAMEFMEEYTIHAVDARAWTSTPHSEWHTDDFTLHKADNTVVSGGSKAWSEGVPSIYGPFVAHFHEPRYLICFETKDGWEMMGQAQVYANLQVPGPEPKVKDGSGRKWDVVTKGAFHFEYVRVAGAKHGGILLKRTSTFADSGPALMMMLKRGQLKPADIGL